MFKLMLKFYKIKCAKYLYIKIKIKYIKQLKEI